MAAEASTSEWNPAVLVKEALANLRKTGKTAARKQSLLHLHPLCGDETVHEEIKNTLEGATRALNDTLPQDASARVTTVNFFVDDVSDVETGTTATKINLAAVNVLVQRMKKRLGTTNYASATSKKRKQLQRAMKNLETEAAKGCDANVKKIEALSARVVQLKSQCASEDSRPSELEAAYHAVCDMVERHGWKLRKPRREQAESKLEEGAERDLDADQATIALDVLGCSKVEEVRPFTQVWICDATPSCVMLPQGMRVFASRECQDNGSCVIKALVANTNNPAEVGRVFEKLQKRAGELRRGWGEHKEQDATTLRLVANGPVVLVVLTPAIEDRHMGVEHQTQWRCEATHWLWQMCGGQFVSEEQENTVLTRLEAAAHTTTGEVVIRLASGGADPYVRIITRKY